MQSKLSLCFLLIFILFSCTDENKKRLLENEKEAKKNEIIFKNIQKNWNFYDTPINPTSEETSTSWNEWRLFLNELQGKPKNSIGAFQKKSKEITKKALALNTNIPLQFDKPQIKSRIATLITQVELLDLFIHLSAIPDKKVVLLIAEINKELVSLQRQMDKIVEKNKIPLEDGESDFLKMLDTSRAIPNTKPDPNLPRVE